jgi:hypothetical protein
VIHQPLSGRTAPLFAGGTDRGAVRLREARRQISSSLFNNIYFADVVLQIAALATTPDEFVTTRKIASACGLADSVVRTVVRLEAAEMLRRLPRMGGPRSEQNFARSISAQWDGLVA